MANLDTLVLDEADQLLEMGFRPAIEQILRNLPSKVLNSMCKWKVYGTRLDFICVWACTALRTH